MSKRVVLAAVGDVNAVATWSGTPYHLLQVARRAGVIHEGLALQALDPGRPRRRLLWNLASVLRGRGFRGYQFSVPCIEHYWRPWLSSLAGRRVINCFQLYPPSVIADARIECWFYIDQTLQQLFHGYGLRADVSRWMERDALRREREGYTRATRIVVHSQWAAESLMQDYGIAAEKISVVVPGFNIDADHYARWAAEWQPPQRSDGATLKLVFVGKDGRRKGLDRLIRAMQLARAQGAALQLTVLGCPREKLAPELQAVEGIEWLGFIDKQRTLPQFIDAVAGCDIGCLLSRAEAGGMGLREFHALGLAVIGPDVGGSPDHVLPEAAELVPPDASDAKIAALLLRLHQDRAAVRRMRAISWARRDELSWAQAVDQLAALS